MHQIPVTPSLFFLDSFLFLLNHVKLCLTNWSRSNRNERGCAEDKPTTDIAKLGTASSVVLLSLSSPRLPLGSGLGGKDKLLARNWHRQLKSHFRHAACQLTYEKKKKKKKTLIDNYRMTGPMDRLSIIACGWVHLCRIYSELICLMAASASKSILISYIR